LKQQLHQFSPIKPIESHLTHTALSGIAAVQLEWCSKVVQPSSQLLGITSAPEPFWPGLLQCNQRL
jgi:hypothetical protein